MKDTVISVGILGATGYTGLELVKRLRRHRHVRIVFAHSDSHAGARLCDVLPCEFDIPLVSADNAPFSAADVVFSCLPHGASAALVCRALETGCRVVDLSADFRLRDPQTYARWYGHPHPAPDLLGQAVYGLPERYRHAIVDARLVANPGCYPTSVILGLLPLIEADALADTVIIADSKSGVSGAGRKPSQTTHFVEVNENLSPYNVGHAHRHVPEMEQEINAVHHAGYRVLFTPHLLPISRGMLSTLYVRLKPHAQSVNWQHAYATRYAGEPFVRVLPAGHVSTIAHAAHTNFAVLSLHSVAELTDRLLIVSCIDNLVKGASGQAIQNMNLMFGLDECEGLQ